MVRNHVRESATAGSIVESVGNNKAKRLADLQKYDVVLTTFQVGTQVYPPSDDLPLNLDVGLRIT